MILYGRWKVTLPGEEYVWEPDETTVAEEFLLESEHGGTFDEWMTGIDDRKAAACQILVWFLRRKAGRQEDRLAVDFPIRRLVTEPIDTPETVAGLPEASAGSEQSGPATSSPSPDTESDRSSGGLSLAKTS